MLVWVLCLQKSALARNGVMSWSLAPMGPITTGSRYFLHPQFQWLHYEVYSAIMQSVWNNKIADGTWLGVGRLQMQWS